MQVGISARQANKLLPGVFSGVIMDVNVGDFVIGSLVCGGLLTAMIWSVIQLDKVFFGDE